MLSSAVQRLHGRGRLGLPAAPISALGILGLILALAGYAVGARPGSASTGVRVPGADALARLGQQARQLAGPPGAALVLRQVSVDPASGRVAFLFTDAAATREIDVLVPSPTAPPDQWQIERPSFSPLLLSPRPGLDLRALRVGPAAATRAATAAWTGCAPRGLTLVGEGGTLTWQAFCTLPDGRVASGAIDGQSGTFRASAAPPAALPPTAAPAR